MSYISIFILACSLQVPDPERTPSLATDDPSLECGALALGHENMHTWYAERDGDYPFLDYDEIGPIKPCHRDVLVAALADEDTCAVAHNLLLNHAEEIPPAVRRLRTVGSIRWGLGGRGSRHGIYCVEGYDFQELWSGVRIRPHLRRVHGDVLRLQPSARDRATARGRPRDR